MRQLIAGNWKMNGLGPALAEIESLSIALAAGPVRADLLVCPPFSLISRAAAFAGAGVAIGGQDCHPEACGAFTGDVSAEMLKDAGATAVIVGHSERRQYHGEQDSLVAAKALAAWRAGLLAIVCVGETEAERDAGHALDIVARQIAASVPDGALSATTAIAYEPVWAIGTGKTPSSADIVQMHAHIRQALIAKLGATGAGLRILYGGSVKPANAAEILALPGVQGALVGGASLKAQDFLAIVRAVPAEP
jgi:triosephosphate isomerase